MGMAHKYILCCIAQNGVVFADCGDDESAVPHGRTLLFFHSFFPLVRFHDYRLGRVTGCRATHNASMSTGRIERRGSRILSRIQANPSHGLPKDGRLFLGTTSATRAQGMPRSGVMMSTPRLRPNATVLCGVTISRHGTIGSVLGGGQHRHCWRCDDILMPISKRSMWVT
eukprot:scaffold80705_cov24-Tisochrysis_lutea.AAC.3